MNNKFIQSSVKNSFLIDQIKKNNLVLILLNTLESKEGTRHKQKYQRYKNPKGVCMNQVLYLTTSSRRRNLARNHKIQVQLCRIEQQLWWPVKCFKTIQSKIFTRCCSYIFEATSKIEETSCGMKRKYLESLSVISASKRTIRRLIHANCFYK